MVAWSFVKHPNLFGNGFSLGIQVLAFGAVGSVWSLRTNTGEYFNF